MLQNKKSKKFLKQALGTKWEPKALPATNLRKPKETLAAKSAIHSPSRLLNLVTEEQSDALAHFNQARSGCGGWTIPPTLKDPRRFPGLEL